MKQNVDPRGGRGQDVAKRWMALLNAFTQSNAQVKQGLNNFYADQSNWPASFKRPWSDEVDRFMIEAKRAANLNCQP